MKYITARQMRRIEQRAIEAYGIPALVLMENAGRGAAQVALEMLKGLKGKKVVCVCGKGNNGGDGFVCARHLMNNAVDTEIFLIRNPEDVKADAKINFSILKAMKAKIRTLKSRRDFKIFREKLQNAHLIVDAIFGIGLSAEIKEPHRAVIMAMNESKKPILAIDVPSGLDATAGDILGICVRASKTVTFGLPKTGFIRNDGPACAGEVVVADISLPRVLCR
jgi:hydroxyethylthiazole kinase-like uncharacterized protein yjeF